MAGPGGMGFAGGLDSDGANLESLSPVNSFAGSHSVANAVCG